MKMNGISKPIVISKEHKRLRNLLHVSEISRGVYPERSRRARDDRAVEESGFVLTVAIIFIIMLVFLADFVLNAGYNQRVMTNNVGETRTRAYYRAQAGVVDANARIRIFVTGIPTGLAAGPGSVGTDFSNPGYNPAPYHLDLDYNLPQLSPTLSTNATIPPGFDVTVDISAVDKNNDGTAVSPLTGRRIIEVTGKDTA